MMQAQRDIVILIRLCAGLEVDRKGRRFFNMPSSFPSGEPPAGGAVAFSANLSGWVGSMPCSLLLWGIFQ
jgi:hypothetical protein